MQFLSQAELNAYKQSMYDYASLSHSLFEEIFRPKFEWAIYGRMYEDNDDPSNGTPKGKCVESRDYHFHENLDVRTWLLCENEQRQTIASLRRDKISEERISHYRASFPYISAVRVMVGGNPAVEAFGFFPYAGPLLKFVATKKSTLSV